MKLSDKPCYPIEIKKDSAITKQPFIERNYGLTFRERLIIALSSNPEMMVNDNKIAMEFEQVAKGIILQADAIIKEVEDENNI